MTTYGGRIEKEVPLPLLPVVPDEPVNVGVALSVVPAIPVKVDVALAVFPLAAPVVPLIVIVASVMNRW